MHAIAKQKLATTSKKKGDHWRKGQKGRFVKVIKQENKRVVMRRRQKRLKVEKDVCSEV